MKKLLLLITSIVFVFNANATHLTGMDLTYECLSGNQYKFTLDLYRDCAGVALGSSQTLTGTSSCNNFTLAMLEVDLSPNDPNTMAINIPIVSSGLSTCNGGTLIGVMHHRYEGIITVASCSDWLMTWNSCCRPSYGVSNIVAPGSTGMAVEVSFDNSVYNCLNSPKFSNDPVFAICNNYPFLYNQGATDADGDSLVFTLVDAFSGASTTVNYQSPYTAIDPIAGVSNLNSATGNFYINANQVMAAVVAIRVEEYRGGVLIGSVMRDMTIYVDSTCMSLPRPSGGVISGISNGTLNSPSEVTIYANEQFDMSITVVDTSGDNSVILSGFFNEYINGAWSMMDSSFFNMNNGSPLIADFNWTPTNNDIGTHEIELEVYSITAYPYWYSYTYPYTINVIESSNSIDFDLENNYQMYPNPASDNLSIRLSEGIDKAQISIIDITGKEYLSQQLSSNSSTLKLDVPKGIYFVKIESTSDSIVKKLVVE